MYGFLIQLYYYGIISKDHSKNAENGLFCLVCNKSIPVGHQGKGDLCCCTPKKHCDILKSKKDLKSNNQCFVTVGSDIDKSVSIAEVKSFWISCQT